MIFEKVNISDCSPIQYDTKSGIWLKRDDLFEVCNMHGGKARAAYQIITNLLNNGYKTIVTAGSRHSPQCEIVSFICENFGVDCKLFMPIGKETSVIRNVLKNSHTQIIRVKPAYNNVLSAKSFKYAVENNFGYVPFGMECAENVNITQNQVLNLPKEAKRIIVPVGSGMTFSSITNGLFINKMFNYEIVGVRVGKDPSKIIQKYSPFNRLLNCKIVTSKHNYSTEIKADIDDVELDPIYEAKCFDYLKPGDVLWIVGKRAGDIIGN